MVTVFRDRVDAGRRLAEAFKAEAPACREGVVLAVPRGGVVVGAQIARELGLPLDLIIPRKIGAPHNPEAAIGAVAQDGTTFFNQHILHVLGLKEKDLQEEIDHQIREIRRR
ncbi:MAG: phosphoribosyltransferase, partial [Moorella sp. (in: Bacteria)]|nr:phosphoribosyltransferase [Moorella sp. (in: firmicutes)]